MSTRSILPESRGQWVRSGGRIILLPGAGRQTVEEMEGETGPIPATQQGVIHPDIHVQAQYALLRMSKSPDPGAQADAWGMLNAVRGNRLGIYKVDQPKPAKRALKLGSSWWTVMPPGEDGMVLVDPGTSEPPFIVFREAVQNIPARLDAALRKAWRTVGMLGRCQRPGGGTLQAEIGGLLPGPANLFPRLLCQVGGPPAQTLPAGLVLLQHFHVPAPLPAFSPTTPVEMTTAAMNPGFINPATDTVTRSSDSAGLQAKLNTLMASKTYKPHQQQMSIALVDLTDFHRVMPEFAGWNETVARVGSSTPKICALYALHQLRFDVQTIAARTGATTTAALDAAVRKSWSDRGLTSNQPDLELLGRPSVTSGPMAVELTSEAKSLVRCTFTENEGRAASLLITRIGLPYISSLLWQSGLFHPTRGGLWLTDHYGTGCQHGGDCCFIKQQLPAHVPGAVNAQPRAVRNGQATTHNLTALSAATFMTLLAQGRLADAGTSRLIEADLQPACTWFDGSLLPCSTTRMPTKCGIFESFVHDCAYVERAGRPDCGGPPIRYAVAVTTHGFLFSSAGARKFMGPLLRDLDILIAQNNPLFGP